MVCVCVCVFFFYCGSLGHCEALIAQRNRMEVFGQRKPDCGGGASFRPSKSVLNGGAKRCMSS